MKLTEHTVIYDSIFPYMEDMVKILFNNMSQSDQLLEIKKITNDWFRFINGKINMS
jgi:hypothetical protein